jgi:hypothetical protein
MAITWRPATWSDIEPCLAIQPANLGDALVGKRVAIDVWRQLFRDPFFLSAVLESSPTINGYRHVGFGAGVLVTAAFADAEIAEPRPNINSRLIAGIHAGLPLLATRHDVARANAGEGVSVLVMCGHWRDDILNPDDRQRVQTLFVASFAQRIAGYRIQRILNESADEPAREFARRSVEYQPIGEFRELGRTVWLMTPESAKTMPASVGNILFTYDEPVLRLRESDQQLLAAALGGAIDDDVSWVLGITLAAVKARWRSVFARISETMPGLVQEAVESEGRGMQKRHRVVNYVREHPQELRPYHWEGKLS